MRRLNAKAPEWSVLLAAVAGWLVFGALVWGRPYAAAPAVTGLPGMPGMPGMSSMPGLPATSGMSRMTLADGLLVWLAMTVAMMLPTTVPMVRYVAYATRRGRRQRSIALFCLAYLAAWFPLGVALALVGPQPAAVVALAVGAAAAWELGPVKRRALRRCHRTYPIRYRGRAADLSALRFGWRHGLTCLLVGGPAMAALMLAGHPLLPTLAVAALMIAQQGLVGAERWRGAVAVGGVVTGLAVLALG